MYTIIGGHKQHCVVCQFILCLALNSNVHRDRICKDCLPPYICSFACHNFQAVCRPDDGKCMENLHYLA